jgi:16S rRNA (uracil1498-N3)-methyltransferase
MWDAVLRSAGADHVACEVQEPVDVAPRLPVEVAFGVGNKSHTLWLVEKATELGAQALWPIEFARSRSVADAARSPSFWRKAERRAVSALKQSGGGWLPRIESGLTAEAFLEGPGRDVAALAGRPVVPVARILLDAEGEPLGRRLRSWDGSAPLMMLVGPEGGLTPGEKRALADRGFRTAALGRRTLRFETAALAALAVASQHLETKRF